METVSFFPRSPYDTRSAVAQRATSIDRDYYRSKLENLAGFCFSSAADVQSVLLVDGLAHGAHHLLNSVRPWFRTAKHPSMPDSMSLDEYEEKQKKAAAVKEKQSAGIEKERSMWEERARLLPSSKDDSTSTKRARLFSSMDANVFTAAASPVRAYLVCQKPIC